MENFNFKKYLAEGKLLKELNEETLKQDIQDFWNLLQDDANQSDGEYEAKWDTEFFIEQYPEYKGEEIKINNIAKTLIPFSDSNPKLKGIKGKESVLDFVKQNLDNVENSILKIVGSGDNYVKGIFKDIKANPKLLAGNERLVQILDTDGDEVFQISFNRNDITDGGYKSKIIVNGINLFVTI
jgi:hypothetical protein